MKKLIFATLILVLGCSPQEFDIGSEYELNEISFEKGMLRDQLLRAINIYRLESGKKILLADRKATKLSEERVDEMILDGEISHDGYSRVASELLFMNAKSVGEILAYGFRECEGMMSSWTKSASHNEIILGDYRYIGIAVKECDSGIIYNCVIFID